MRVAAIQHDIFWEDPDANFHRLDGMITGAAAAGARLVVLPELFATGSSWTTAIAESDDGPTVSFLRDAAERADAWVCGTVALRSGGEVVNAVLIAGPDGTLHRSHKHHLSEGREADLFTAKKKVDAFSIEDLRVAPFVGRDLWYPHDFWDAAADVDVFIVPGAEPESRRTQWRTLLASRAIENKCYVIGVNRVGTGGGVSYTGDSQIVDPQGETLALGSGTETILLAEVESALVRFTRDRNPLLGDRVPATITLG